MAERNDGSGIAAVITSPLGPLALHLAGGRLSGIDVLPAGSALTAPEDPLTREAARQLAAYFADPAFAFDLPLAETGTPYQRRVWAALRAIPVGQVESYGALARHLASGARAVGQACRSNPLPIVTPCHRVIAAHGPGGYAGHTDGGPLRTKRWLLAHEGADLKIPGS